MNQDNFLWGLQITDGLTMELVSKMTVIAFGVECRVLVTDKPIMGGIFSSLSIFCGISLAVWVSFVVFYCL